MNLPEPGSGAVWSIAHRGASRRRPENTAAAFDEALRCGCDAIELDVQLSRDGVPVVYHDRTLARAGGGRRRVAMLDLRDLRELDPGARFDPALPRQHIPTVAEVLRRYGRRVPLLVEIKIRERNRPERHLELARGVARLAVELELERRVTILCFDAVVLEEVARTSPALPRVLNLDRLRPRLPRGFADALQGVSVDWRALDSRLARRVRDAGLPLLVFTCNTASQVRRAIEAGADAIMSDRPEWLGPRLRRGKPGR